MDSPVKLDSSDYFDDNDITNDFEEMMIIEVHYGKGRTDNVRVRFDDKPEDLARV